MKKMLVGLLMIGVLMTGSALAAGFDYSVGFMNKYVWRGFDMTGDQPAIQPGLNYTFDSGLSLSFWGNYNIGSKTAQGITEADLIIGYGNDLAPGLFYTIGYTYYTFPQLTGAAAKSGEPYAGLTWTDVQFTPNVTLYYDHDQGNGLYAAFSGGQDFYFAEQNISSGLTVGFNAGQWGATSGISDINLAFSSDYAVSDITITPFINYIVIGKDTGVNTKDSETVVGVSVGGSF